MKGINILNDIKIGFKVIGCFGLIFAVVAVMMLSGTKVRMDAVRGVDSMYRQYIESIRETGELKAGIEKMEAYLYHYVAMPSARNNTLESIKKETNSIDQIVQTYKGKVLAPEEKKILSDFDAAWPEIQRGYKEIMKLADDGKRDDVARLLAEGSYFIAARHNTLAAVRNLNDYNTSRNEAAIKANSTDIGGWASILWLLSAIGTILLIVMGIMIIESLIHISEPTRP